jgi:hypothetical protein
VAFSRKLLFDDLISAVDNSKPPIRPALAVICPSGVI